MTMDIAPYSPQPSQQNTRLITADDCYYPPLVKAFDLLLVDFDSLKIDGSGLYLLEEVKGGAVVWRGCRRFDVLPAGTVMDLSGDGDWSSVDLDSVGWRIAGKVEAVYRRQL